MADSYLAIDLMPGWWHSKIKGHFKKPDDFLVLGSNGIQTMVTYWRKVRRDKAAERRRVEKVIAELEGMTNETIRQEAEQHTSARYERDDITTNQVGGHIYPFPYQRTPFWESERPEGSTTFNNCGWCKHALGSVASGVNFAPTCRFLEPIGRDDGSEIPTAVLTAYMSARNSGAPVDTLEHYESLYPGIERLFWGHTRLAETRRFFFTPCMFKHHNMSSIVVARLKRLVSTILEEERRVERKARFLLYLARRAEWQPAFWWTRNGFQRGERVVLITRGMEGATRTLAYGLVVETEIRPTCKVVLDGPVFPADRPGTIAVVNTNERTVMSAEDWKYMKAHPDFASLWWSIQEDNAPPGSFEKFMTEVLAK